MAPIARMIAWMVWTSKGKIVLKKIFWFRPCVPSSVHKGSVPALEDIGRRDDRQLVSEGVAIWSAAVLLPNRAREPSGIRLHRYPAVYFFFFKERNSCVARVSGTS